MALVAGGSQRCVRLASNLTVDASGSYDQDQPGVLGTQAGLSFRWSCSQETTTSSGSSVCSVIISQVSDPAKIVVVAAGSSSPPGTTSVVTVSVMKAVRSAFAAVSVTVVPSVAALISLSASPSSTASLSTSPFVSQLLNPSSGLALTATVVAAGPTEVVWSVNDTSLSLSQLALTPVQQHLSVSASTAKTVNLVLPPNCLKQGTSYRFTVTALQSNTQPSFASIDVTTNGPPMPGVYTTTPALGGTAIQTLFQFAASLWVDSNLPLTFAFGFLSTTGSFQVLQSQSASSYGSSMLPAGPQAVNYFLTTVGQIYDSFNANSTATASAQVLVYQGTSQALQIALLSQLSAGQSSQITQTISTAGATLNAVSCANTPNCTALNRQACSTTANTCGPCLPSSFIGDLGSSNSPCIKGAILSASSRALSHTTVSSSQPAGEAVLCAKSSECGLFQQCIGNYCVSTARTCPGNCNGHGSCKYVEPGTASVVPSCNLGDTTCVPVCLCSAGYAGADCSKTVAQMASLQSMRRQLLIGLLNLTQSQNVNAFTVTSWLSSLASLAQLPTELDQVGISTVVIVAHSIFNSATSLGMSYDSLQPLLSVVDSIAQLPLYSVASSSVNSTRRTLAAVGSGSYDDVSTSSLLIPLISNYASSINTELYLGQRSVSSVQSQYRGSSTIQSSSSNSYSGIMQQSTPLTNLEVVQKLPPHTVVWGIPSPFQILASTVFSMYSDNYGGSDVPFNSNPIALIFQASIRSIPASGLAISLVIPNVRSVSYVSAPPAGASFILNCSNGIKHSQTLPCSNGLTVTGVCDGLFGGHVQVSCPYLATKPICAILRNNTIVVDSICSTESYSPSATICNCKLSSALLVTSTIAFGLPDPRTLDSASREPSIGVQFVVVTQSSVVSVPAIHGTYSPTLQPTKSAGTSSAVSVLLTGAFMYRYMIVGIVLGMCVCASLTAVTLTRFKRYKNSEMPQNQEPESPEEIFRQTEISPWTKIHHEKSNETLISAYNETFVGLKGARKSRSYSLSPPAHLGHHGSRGRTQSPLYRNRAALTPFESLPSPVKHSFIRCDDFIDVEESKEELDDKREIRLEHIYVNPTSDVVASNRNNSAGIVASVWKNQAHHSHVGASDRPTQRLQTTDSSKMPKNKESTQTRAALARARKENYQLRRSLGLVPRSLSLAALAVLSRPTVGQLDSADVACLTQEVGDTEVDNENLRAQATKVSSPLGGDSRLREQELFSVGDKALKSASSSGRRNQYSGAAWSHHVRDLDRHKGSPEEQMNFLQSSSVLTFETPRKFDDDNGNGGVTSRFTFLGSGLISGTELEMDKVV